MNTKFSDAILKRKKEGFIPVIPDIKCISPKEGDMLKGRDPVEIVNKLVDAGTPALSVVTESQYFGGSMELLAKITKKFPYIPVLRKDFIKNIDELRLSREYGASAILLICSVQPFQNIKMLYDKAIEEKLEPLIEVHTKEELKFALKIGASLIGINNRDIVGLEKDEGTVSLTKMLIKHIPGNVTVISESSIKTPQEAKEAIDAGADAVLVGTALWQAQNANDLYFSLAGRID